MLHGKSSRFNRPRGPLVLKPTKKLLHVSAVGGYVVHSERALVRSIWPPLSFREQRTRRHVSMTQKTEASIMAKLEIFQKRDGCWDYERLESKGLDEGQQMNRRVELQCVRQNRRQRPASHRVSSEQSLMKSVPSALHFLRHRNCTDHHPNQAY